MTTAPDDELPGAIARFWTADGQVAGSGFLIAEGTLCTCAHVVAAALGVPDTDRTPPASPLTVDFPLLTPPSPRLTATVTHWRPVAPDGGGDMALLALEATVPGTTAVRFAGGTAVWDHAFRILGFPLRTDEHGVWVDGRLRAPVGKGWTSMEPRPSPRGPVIGRGFSGAPVWDTEQGGVVGMTVAADTGTGATTAYLIPTALLLGLDPARCPSPFRGLESFREQDASVFFARRADSERIAGALLEHPFVPVAGASGVGKSSLVRAGVLPLLRASGHTVTDFAGQPDTDPVRTLAEALGAQFPPARELARQLGADREAAVLLGARILEEAGTAGHVILLDQFEETVGARPADARALLDVLLPMARAAHPAGRRLRVLATLRSASLEELVTGGRAEALSGTVQMVAPMTPAQLDQVVRCPVDAVPGVEFEPGLPELLVADAGAEPGALPLLEFTLAELWDRREHGRLTHAAYREIGGVEGALSRYADHQLAQVCKPPDGPDEPTARRLFERLARPVRDKEYARVARAFDQLPPELRTAAQALAATRLLVISRDSSGKETVALAHEALVRQWPALRRWLDESRTFLAWHEKLRGRLREWEDGGRHDDLLLRGQELTTAKSSAVLRPDELSAAETAFIRLSRYRQRRSVRRSRTGVALVACLAVLAGLLGYGLWGLMRDQGQGEKDRAAQQLAEYAADRAVEDPVGAALLAAAAHRTSELPESEAALMRHAWPLTSLASAHRVLPAGKVTDVAASADGRVMIVLKGTEAYAITGLARGNPKRWPLPGAPPSMNSVAVSDDGKRAAAAAAHGEVRVWELDGGVPEAKPRSLRWHPDGKADTTVTLDFSSDARRLVHAVSSSDEYCVGETLRPWVYVMKVDRQPARDGGTVVPERLVQPGECLSELALRSGQPGHLTVLTYTEGSEARYTARSMKLSTGEIEHGPRDRKAVQFAAGGRAFAWKQGNERFWRWQLPAGKQQENKGRWSEPFDTDATGRFLYAGGISEGGSAGPDGVWGVLQDLASGRRYAVVMPGDVARRGGDMVMTRTDKGLVAYAALGRDVLSLRMTAESSYPIGVGGAVDVADMDRVAGHDMLVALTKIYVDQGESTFQEVVDSEVVLDGRGRGPRRHEVDRDTSFTEIEVSEDGRSFVAWGTVAWELRTTDGFRRLNDESPSAAKDGSSASDTDQEMESVRRFGHGDFLLLDGRGLAHLDGATGELDRLDEVGCARDEAPGDRACVTAVGRPHAPGEFLVLRADGDAELWRLKGDSSAAKVDGCAFPHLGDARSAVFRPDGRSVAVATGSGVFVWRPGERKPTLLAPGAGEVRAYGGDGHLVLTTPEDEDELWNDNGNGNGNGEPVKLHAYAFDHVKVWLFDGHFLHAETGLGSVTYDLDFLTGRATADDLCEPLPARLPGVWDNLLNTLDIPPAAEKDPPCPDRG
ncbi:nSTAND1 domain-containing NTPase [Streptomyces blattellae]|uniref:nSTAND1 domain-containing NTPase n=1 Tax=Streptomyces blattellae TaxID=2569855 RepID=UPI0012BA200D|nr:trypsin-like peptidase domain-containing protein [Streptomyces blattellae]